MILTLVMLIALGSPQRNRPIEVDTILFNYVHDIDDGEIRFSQIVFMDKMGNSLGFYSYLDEESFSHYPIGNILFLRSCNKMVKYRKRLQDKHTYDDYEVTIRKKSVERLIP